MKFEIDKKSLLSRKADLILLWHFSSDSGLSEAVQAIDEACGGPIRTMLAAKDFQGKTPQAMLYTGGAIPASRIMLIGLESRDKAEAEAIRNAYAAAVQKMRSLKIRSAAVSLDFGTLSALSTEAAIGAALEGFVLGDYRYDRFKTSEGENTALLLAYLSAGSLDSAALKAAAQRVEKIAEAVYLARDLGNAPANVMTPSRLATEAKKMTVSRPIKCTVLDREKIRKAGMTALLGVSQGSQEPPTFTILDYRGGRPKQAPVVLIGKGITFDSGGISLKPAENMGEMKSDMAGAAAVIATLRASADLKLRVNLVGVIPATENMPGGKAYRPGDVITPLGGKTIEIISTDAEGRLILADAIAYAARFKPAVMIDVATLTGACVVALGDEVAGLFGNDNAIKRKLIAASQTTGEKIWEMPLWDCYQELIKSDIADLKNTGGRNGGAITAAAFLNQYVGAHPWAHIDIAGPAFSSKARPYIPKGASGFGVRLLVQFLTDYAQGKGR